MTEYFTDLDKHSLFAFQDRLIPNIISFLSNLKLDVFSGTLRDINLRQFVLIVNLLLICQKIPVSNQS